MRRAGLDYHEYAGLSIYENWQEFRDKQPRARLFGLSTKGSRFYTEVTFENGTFWFLARKPEACRSRLGQKSDRRGYYASPCCQKAAA